MPCCRFCPVPAGGEAPSFTSADAMSRHLRESKTCTASKKFEAGAYAVMLNNGATEPEQDGRK